MKFKPLIWLRKGFIFDFSDSSVTFLDTGFKRAKIVTKEMMHHKKMMQRR